MRIDNSVTTLRGDEWRVAGYSSPRTKGAPIYRLIRTRDGARVRLYSNKLYWLSVSRQTIAELDDIATGTDERANGSGAASLASDRRRVGLVS